MPTNEFLTFAAAGGANVVSQATYSGAAYRGPGFSAGIAKSNELNKVWRQSSVIAAAVAQAISTRLSQDVLDNGDQAALVAQILAAFPTNTSVSRAGEMFMWPKATPPAYALERAGQAVSRTTYAALFAVIGTDYGAGDGSTTFNLPDDRGLFERGWDHGAGVGTNATFGAYQADAVGPLTLSQNLSVWRSNPAGSNVNRLMGNDNGGSGTYNLSLSGGGVETVVKNRSYLPCICF